MPRGPKPTPRSVLKLVRSNALRKDRHKNTEPEPTPGEPICPDVLDAAGRKAWKTLVGTLQELGLLTTADGILMALLCQEWALWCAASKEVNRLKRAGAFGEMRKTQTIANDSAKTLIRVAAEFGLGPSARTRIDVPNAGKKQDVFDKYLTGGGS